MMIGACPECDASVSFETAPGLHQRVICVHCRAELVVIGINPIRLDWAYVEPLRDIYQEGARMRFDHKRPTNA
jgi:lysine biosynthesis protein LysW